MCSRPCCAGKPAVPLAVAIDILENSRVNAFAFWRNTAVRTAELIGLRPVAMPTAIGTSQPVARIPAKPVDCDQVFHTRRARGNRANCPRWLCKSGFCAADFQAAALLTRTKAAPYTARQVSA